MARVNMSNYNSGDVSSFKQVPPGVYLVKAVDGSVSYSRGGNEMWRMTYEIVDQGTEFCGQKLFENIVFSPNTMNRVKLIFESFEIETPNEEKDYQVDDLIGRMALVEVTHLEDYIDKKGIKKTKSVIGFAGYYPPTTDAKSKAKMDDDDIPF